MTSISYFFVSDTMIKLQDSGTNEFKTILILADNGFILKNSFNNLNEVQNTINKEIATYGYNLLEADHSILFFFIFQTSTLFDNGSVWTKHQCVREW